MGGGPTYPWGNDPLGYLKAKTGLNPQLYSYVRDPVHNFEVGGAPGSEHLPQFGQAADTSVPGMPMDQYAAALTQAGIPADQIINEGDHVHVGFARSGNDRGQTFGMHGAPAPPQMMNQSLGGTAGDPTDAAFNAARTAAPQGDPLDAVFAAAAHPGPAPAPKPAQASAPQMSTSEDVLRSLGSGALQGAENLADLPFDVTRLGLQGAANAVGFLDPKEREGVNAFNQYVNAASNAVRPNLNLLGSDYQPRTTAGRYAQTTGSFLPGLLTGGEGLASDIPGIARALASRVIAPAVTSETAGQLTQGTPFEGAARLAGALLGGAPGAGGSVFRAATTPFTTPALSAADAGLVRAYEELGGNLRPGQYNPSQLMRQGDAVVNDLPFRRLAGAGSDITTRITPEEQADQFTRLVSRTIGEDTTRLTGDVLNNAQTRIGGDIGRITSSYGINADPATDASIAALENDLSRRRPSLKSADADQIAGAINTVKSNLSDGLSGENYQGMRQRGGMLDDLSRDGNPTIAGFGTRLRGVLDDAFDRQVPPDQADALATARAQYRALQTIRPTVEKSPTGTVPMGAALLGNVVGEYGSAANAGDLGTLARVGKAYLQEARSSGTTERGFWRKVLSNPLVAAGELAATPGIATIGRGINAAINSPDARRRALAAALMQPGATNIPGLVP